MAYQGLTAEPALAPRREVTLDDVDRWLRHCPELARFCSQNGWIDADSISFEVRESRAGCVLVAVKFTELVMKGAGCEGRRMPCFAQLWLACDERGELYEMPRNA